MCKNMPETLYHHAECKGAWTLHAAETPKNDEYFLFVCVCPLRFWTTEIMCMTLPRRHWNIEIILMLLDTGKFVVVHPSSAFSITCQLVMPQNAKVQKTVKFEVFWYCNRINQSRRNLVYKCRPWVYSRTPNVALTITGSGQGLIDINRRTYIWPAEKKCWHTSSLYWTYFLFH